MKIMLIGGTGFLGRAFSKYLVDSSIETLVLSRNEVASRDRMLGVTYCMGDWSSLDVLRSYIDKSITHVVHLVSTTVPSTAELDPDYDIESNLLPSIQLFRHCGAVGVKRVIFTSSGGTVYGPHETMLLDESLCTNPICSYGVVKVAIENYLKYFSKKYCFNYTVLRISNPYGPFQSIERKQGIVGIFMRSILQGEEIKIFGDGSAVRDYIYVDDVASAFLKVVELSSSGVFNIGSSIGVSINKLLYEIEKVCGVKARMVYVPIRGYDVSSVVLSSSLAKSSFSWAPEIDLSEGLKRTLIWCKNITN